MNVAELLDELKIAIYLADKEDLEVVVWHNDDGARIPVERQGKVILLVVEKDGTVSELTEPADLASNIADEGYRVDFKTGRVSETQP